VQIAILICVSTRVVVYVAILLRILYFIVEYFDGFSIQDLDTSFAKLWQTFIIKICILVLEETIAFADTAALFLFH